MVWVFPSKSLSKDPRSKVIRRHHVNDSPAQRAMKQATRGAGISKPATPHTLRRSGTARPLRC